MSGKSHFLGDTPIKKTSEDLFNFKHYAEKVQKLIQANTNNEDPLTIGIYGKWGEGKTSFLKLIENKIDLWEKESNQKGILKYHFNPWRYSTEDEMLFDFFDGLANKMFVKKEKGIEKVGKGILRVSRYLKAVKLSATAGLSEVNKLSASIDVGEIFKALGEDFSGEEITINHLKELVNQSLKEANYKIVVFIDDIDRLDKDEIYTILKLIKLNASFENFVYLITLDKEHVGKAISERFGNNAFDGELFLEKIINIPIILPRIEDEDLKFFFETKLNIIKNNLVLEREEEKNNEFKEIVDFFDCRKLDSPREVIRLLNGFYISAFAILEEVNLFDLFILEYIKHKNIKCYNFIKEYSLPNITMLGNIIDFNDDYRSSSHVNGSRDFIQKEFQDVFVFFNKIFPLKKELKNIEKKEKELRVNFTNNFNVYFSYHTNRKISSSIIYRIEDTIKAGDEDLLFKQFQELFSKGQNHKAIYRIETLINTTTDEDNRAFFLKFIFDNLSFIDEKLIDPFNKNYRIRIVEKITNLVKNRSALSISYILKLVENLNVKELSAFLENYEKYRGDLGEVFIKKINIYIKNKELVFKDPLANRYVIKYWSQFDREGLNNYLKVRIIDINDVKLLVRNFASYFNNSFFGGIDSRDFNYMQNILDVDIIFYKILKCDVDLVNQIDISEYPIPDRLSKTNAFDNLKQFIFWYKKNKKEISF